MKKVLLSLLALVLVLGGLAYQNQTALMLALVKYKSANEYEVGPPRDIPWSAGPAQASEAPLAPVSCLASLGGMVHPLLTPETTRQRAPWSPVSDTRVSGAGARSRGPAP